MGGRSKRELVVPPELNLCERKVSPAGGCEVKQLTVLLFSCCRPAMEST